MSQRWPPCFMSSNACVYMCSQLRVVLRRNAVRGRSGVLWFLSIVHAVVHSVSIASILTSSIDKFGVTLVSTEHYVHRMEPYAAYQPATALAATLTHARACGT